MKKVLGFILITQIGFMTLAWAECLNPKKISSARKKSMNSKRENQLACLREAHFLLPPPAGLYNDEKIAKEIVSPSNKLGLKNGEDVHCRFVFEDQNGSSKKFRCALTTPEKVFVDDKGHPVPDAKDVKSEDGDDFLVDSKGNKIPETDKNGNREEDKFVQPAILKVRYTDHGGRNVENFSSTAASRILWLLGVPAHSNIMTSKVICEGCSSDPFSKQKEPIVGIVSEFPFASIEIKFHGKRLYSPTEQSWSWKDINDLKKKSQGLSEDQKLETEVFGLATQFLAYAGTSTMQNALVCSEFNKSSDEALDKIYCNSVVAMTHDVGGSLGKRVVSFLARGDMPRADLDSYVKTPVFKSKCSYLQTDSSEGLPQGLSETGRLAFLDRAQAITSERLKAIFEASSMDRVKNKTEGDPKLIQRWVEAVQAKLSQIREARCEEN